MNSESLANVLTRQWRIVTGSKIVNRGTGCPKGARPDLWGRLWRNPGRYPATRILTALQPRLNCKSLFKRTAHGATNVPCRSRAWEKLRGESFRLFTPSRAPFLFIAIGDNYAAAAGEGEGGRIPSTERISAPFALIAVALPLANALKKSRARGP